MIRGRAKWRSQLLVYVTCWNLWQSQWVVETWLVYDILNCVNDNRQSDLNIGNEWLPSDSRFVKAKVRYMTRIKQRVRARNTVTGRHSVELHLRVGLGCWPTLWDIELRYSWLNHSMADWSTSQLYYDRWHNWLRHICIANNDGLQCQSHYWLRHLFSPKLELVIGLELESGSG